ncbi:hypothetical protein GMDG_07944 [Pseudogymnoascus destructans 20631-21]|uniref:Uncharacterized protein n=2 Tax=Pseudogymnoascus destructans TaxID=655981 RepID=L8G0P6_PSED2|nr:hypothetical protein GMDG_07944 [Pseudogymnoascus destructans 20631-21]
MASNVASADPSMALGRRQELHQLRIPFRILPHEILFTPTLGDIMSKQQLRNYVDGLLEELAHQYPTTISPQPGVWKLVRDNADVDLDKWDPCSLEVDKALFITSNIKTSRAIVASTTATRNGPWTWDNGMMSVHFPDRDAFVLEGYNHILVVLRCQTKLKISNKKKRIEETSHTVFIPTTYTVQDLLRLIQASNVCGVFVESHKDNLRWSGSSASELGWQHGTVLRLELW